MSLSSALAIAMSGLRADQAALSVVSGNVANAQTPGYVARTTNQVEIATADTGPTVAVDGVQRQLDLFLQSQLRTETSGGSFASQTSNILGQLQSIYGTPGSAGSLEQSFTNLTASVQSLSANPGSQAAQSSTLTTAQSLATQLNTVTNGIQTLRSNVEQDIAVSVNQANAAMSQIAAINHRLQGLDSTDPAAATLMDQRDAAINQLSRLMDIRAVTDNANQTSIFTTSGVELVGNEASKLSFDAQGSLTANSLYNTKPAKSGVGTITLTLGNGAALDMIATKSIRSGQIAADLQLRDKTLVQAQSQVDQMAATLASSLSDTTTNGTAVSSGTQNGFTVDTSNVLPGNTINLTYTDVASNTQRQVTIVRVDDPAALPLTNTSLPNAGGTVIGVNFSGGMASVVAQLNAALGNASLQFSNPAGNTLQVLNSSGASTLNAASVTTTASALAGGAPQLPLFTDGNTLFTGSFSSISGAQQTGFAGRITVNPALAADPSKLQVFNTSPLTQPGDTTRPDFIYTQLTSASFRYAPQTGLGSPAFPFQGTLPNFVQQFLTQQGNAATAAQQLKSGQDVVVNTLQQKFNATSGVNIDNEMANLISLQNSYSASAHVMSVVQAMMSSLMQIQL